MKPLLKSELKNFLSRFDRFTGAEIRKVSVKSPSVIEMRFSVQDTGRSFDWIDIALEVSNIKDARLVDDTKLSFLDMQEGMSILFEDNGFVIAHGDYSTKESAKNSPFYIIGDSLKFEELPFSG